MNAPKTVDWNNDDDPSLERTDEGVRVSRASGGASAIASDPAGTFGMSLSGRRVVVVGYGALGPMIAHNLVSLGCEVIVIDDGAFNTALTAAGWIMVYHPRDPRGPNWGVQAEALWAEDGKMLYPEELRAVTWEPTVLERTHDAAPFPAALKALRDFNTSATNAPGVAETVELTTAVAPAALWKPRLTEILEKSGRFSRIVQHVPDAEAMANLADVHDADVVVDATGMNQAHMNHDKKFSLDFGMVGYLERPHDWTHGVRSRDITPVRAWSPHSISEQFGFRGGSTDPYYVTQTALNRIVVGGCMWPMTPEEATELRASGYKVDPDILAFIIARAEEHFPELQGLNFTADLGACSIRPSRDKFLLEWDGFDRRVLHVGGAGGAGITLAPVFAHHVATAIESRLLPGTGC